MSAHPYDNIHGILRPKQEQKTKIDIPTPAYCQTVRHGYTSRYIFNETIFPLVYRISIRQDSYQESF